MTIPMFDDFLYDIPSLRIPPLQDPIPPPSTDSERPPPLEPNALVNIDSEANKLTGRRKALAQAKPLDAPESQEWDTLTSAKITCGLETQGSDLLQDRPQKKQKRYDHDQIADFVQLPKPSTKLKDDKPRPFQPISVLNELHEPPPSAALFPPITPSATQEEQEDLTPGDKSSETSKLKRQEPVKRKEPKERATSPGATTRKSNRARRKWTEEEIEYLVKGVTIYGMGRWKSILEHPDLQFQDGRTAMDLKDRFRVCFPPNAPHKWVRPMPEKMQEREKNDDGNSMPPNLHHFAYANASVALPTALKEFPEKATRPGRRARKRHWSEEEDAELEKGFERHGFNWNLIVKDPNLHFENRSGGQVRDRFRLRFKDLYARQDVVQNKAAEKAFQRTNIAEKKPPLTMKSSDKAAQAEDDEDDNSARRKTTPKPIAPSLSFSSGLLNGEDEDTRLSNSILHTDWDWDENVTLAPLAPVAWEDMATRPMFSFD